MERILPLAWAVAMPMTALAHNFSKREPDGQRNQPEHRH